jgi:membrane fusion protein (multidrug efflux system)
VGRSSVSEGALVANGQADELATVTQLDPIFVDISQPVTDMLRLRRALAEGDLQTVAEGEADVELILEDGTVYPLAGTLKFAEVSVDQSTGTVALRAQFPNPDKLLLPGMFVRARLQEGVRENALLVPQQAVVRDSRGAPSAWVLAADNSVHLRELQTLRTVGNAWLIGGGLAPGEQVVVEGLQRIRSGIVVKPVATDDLQLAVEAGAPGAEGG